MIKTNRANQSEENDGIVIFEYEETKPSERNTRIIGLDQSEGKDGVLAENQNKSRKQVKGRKKKPV